MYKTLLRLLSLDCDRMRKEKTEPPKCEQQHEMYPAIRISVEYENDVLKTALACLVIMHLIKSNRCTEHPATNEII